MKIGDLIRYIIPSGGRVPLGIILAIEPDMNPRHPYRVRWTDHTESERNWYSEQELVKL